MIDPNVVDQEPDVEEVAGYTAGRLEDRPREQKQGLEESKRQDDDQRLSSDGL